MFVMYATPSEKLGEPKFPDCAFCVYTKLVWKLGATKVFSQVIEIIDESVGVTVGVIWVGGCDLIGAEGVTFRNGPRIACRWSI